MRRSTRRFAWSLVVVVAAACGGTTTGIQAGEGDSGAGGRDGPGSCNNDGRRDDGEQCDGTDLGSATCSSQTMGVRQAGSLRCDTECRINTSGCVTNGGGAGGRRPTGSGGSGGMNVAGGTPAGGTAGARPDAGAGGAQPDAGAGGVFGAGGVGSPDSGACTRAQCPTAVPQAFSPCDPCLDSMNCVVDRCAVDGNRYFLGCDDRLAAWRVSPSACETPCGPRDADGGGLLCASGALCVERGVGFNFRYSCEPNPCSATPTCACAGSLCGGSPLVCTGTDPTHVFCDCLVCS